METVIVTRHAGLVEYLIHIGLITQFDTVIPHATEDDVRFKRVIGVVPLRLAALAEEVVEVPLELAPSDRGVELSFERIAEIAGTPMVYKVKGVKLDM